MIRKRKDITEYILSILAKKDYTESQIRQKIKQYMLKTKQPESEESAEQIVSWLKSKNFINDTSYAQRFANDRQHLKPRSKRVLNAELRQKGISPEVIEMTLETYDEKAACHTLALKKGKHDKKKLTDYLLRQGFPYDIVQPVVEEVIS